MLPIRSGLLKKISLSNQCMTTCLQVMWVYPLVGYGSLSFLKNEDFMWLLEQRAILTKENMIKQKWQGAPDCYFCGTVEDCDHLMFSCPVAKVIWGL
jgi:hypothetical protein